jgi:hypothetical protein
MFKVLLSSSILYLNFGWLLINLNSTKFKYTLIFSIILHEITSNWVTYFFNHETILGLNLRFKKKNQSILTSYPVNADSSFFVKITKTSTCWIRMLVSHFLVRVVGKKILIFSFSITIVFIQIWKYLMCLLSFLIINSGWFKTSAFSLTKVFNVINFRDLHCQKLRYFIDTNSHLVHVKLH